MSDIIFSTSDVVYSTWDMFFCLTQMQSGNNCRTAFVLSHKQVSLIVVSFFGRLVYKVHELVEFRSDDYLCATVALFSELAVICC